MTSPRPYKAPTTGGTDCSTFLWPDAMAGVRKHMAETGLSRSGAIHDLVRQALGLVRAIQPKPTKED